ncbi:MAG: Ig-like domain-containing protein [Saprospiraceae bacterium]|nr:Ig-like domain-containing protein [Saprospiraceae bacterium]
MKKLQNLLFVAALGLIAISCGDDDSAAPVVTISTPTAGTSYTVADTISLTGNVTEDTELASIAITSDLGVDESITNFDSDTTHSFNYSITLDSLTAAGDYTFTVTATDEAGNTGSDDVQISIQ